MDGFWERTGEFLGRLVFAAAYMWLMIALGELPTIHAILFCVAIVILDFVCVIESGEKVRMVFFCLFSALLVISAGVYHISILGEGGTENALQISFFPVCAALSFFIWFEISRIDSVFSWVDLIIYGAGWVLGLLNGIFDNAMTGSIVFLVIGIVFMAVLPIMRFGVIRESAFGDFSEWWSARESSSYDRGSSGSLNDETAQMIHEEVDGLTFSFGGDKYFTVHYNGSIKVAMSGVTFDNNVGAYKRKVRSEIEDRLRSRGLPVPSIVFYD